jgi:hypothetical protein
MFTNLIESLVARRNEGEARLRDILDTIALELHHNPKSYGLSSPEQADDIFVKYHDRFIRLVKRYEERGRGFISLLATTVRFLVKSEYRNERREGSLVAVAELCEEEYSRSRGNEPNPKRIGEKDAKACVEKWLSSRYDRKISKNELDGMKTKLLVLCVKSAMWISRERIMDIASITSRNAVDLERSVDEAKRCVMEKARKYERLAVRRNDVFVKLCTLEHKLVLEPAESERKVLRKEIGEIKNRYLRMSSSLRAAKLVPGNHVVAKALGIPKGTVDACMHYMKTDLHKAALS